MVFLHEHGVGTARAVRIYKTYGADAVHLEIRSDRLHGSPFQRFNAVFE